MRHHLLFAAMVLLACSSGFGAKTQLKPAHQSPDEQAIEKTIDELGDVDFQTRKAATEKLEAFGPEVVPMLQKYREHGDPEVEARINKVIRSFGWMEKGAIVSRIENGSNAQQMGLNLGDVVVKIGDVDVTTHLEVTSVRTTNAATVFIWRAGKVLQVDVPSGRLGVILSNWDIAKGGNDHARGLSLLSGKKPDFEEAYRRLKSAREQGMNDVHTLFILAGLAARALDRDYADECYQSVGRKSGCLMTHAMTEDMPLNVPVVSPHTAWLLKRYSNEPLTTYLSHDLEDWFARTGRNSPMLAEVLAKPRVGEDHPSYQYYHDIAAATLALSQRRYADATPELLRIDDAKRGKSAYTELGAKAMQGAIRNGDTDTAAKIGLAMLGNDTLDTEGKTVPSPALWGLASAAANGNQAWVDTYFDRISKLNGAQAKALGRMASLPALNNPAAGAALLKYFDARGPTPFASGLRQVGLAALIADPASTRERFDLYVSKYDLTAIDEAFCFTMLTGALRFGDHERAAKILDTMGRRFAGNNRPARDLAKYTLDFAKQNAESLAGDWKEMNGAVQVVKAPDSDVFWALRYDGQIFRVRPGQKPETFGGLPVPPSPVSAAYAHFYFRPGGIVLVIFPFGRDLPTNPGLMRRTLVYALAPESSKWTPLADFDKPLGQVLRREVLRAIADKMVAANYPALPGGTPREYWLQQTFSWYEGDILIHADDRTGIIRDLSAEIGKRAGRDKPALIYKPEERFQTRWLLYSDCGAWLYDTADGALKRIELGLNDQNVITCSLPKDLFGTPRDGIYVGVAPQHGGQIFIFDPWTAQTKATNGYNGVGPNDWYADRCRQWHLADPQEFIYQQYLARLARK